MDTCQGIFGRLFGHQFEAIFDEKPSVLPSTYRGPSWLAEGILKAGKQRTYRGIFCKRCGKREDV